MDGTTRLARVLARKAAEGPRAFSEEEELLFKELLTDTSAEERANVCKAESVDAGQLVFPVAFIYRNITSKALKSITEKR